VFIEGVPHLIFPRSIGWEAFQKDWLKRGTLLIPRLGRIFPALLKGFVGRLGLRKRGWFLIL